MLTSLSIRNLAIIENITLSFQEGFTVLLGETGAGKSLIIDSLSLLLGSRASSELIRAGEEKAIIEGRFSPVSLRTKSVLARIGIESNEGEVCITRVLSKKGSQNKINGIGVSLSDLQAIGNTLADIHTQFDFVKILNPDHYLGLIDGYSPVKTSRLLSSYQEALERFKKAVKIRNELQKKQDDFLANKDFLLYARNELVDAKLQKREEQSLEEELRLLKNHDKVFSIAQEAEALIRGDSLDALYELSRLLGKLATYQKEFEETQKLVEERYFELDDAFSTLKKRFASMDYDPSRLDELEQRQMDIEGLKRKYKRSFDELLAYRDELLALTEEEDLFPEKIQEAEREVSQARALVIERGSALSAFRKGLAAQMEKEILTHLSDLGLEASFQIAFSSNEEGKDEEFGELGMDAVDFLMETNVGEGLKPISKVLSGGEASRIMLALRALFLSSSGVSTLVLDEIDTGISGETASKVGRKIEQLSMLAQTIVISHSPQVAAMGDHLLYVSKKESEGRTRALVEELHDEEAVNALAQMIAGDKVTPASKEAAREMLRLHAKQIG
ncbi:MAG: DNA repair protein RecN [Candidatus Enteromonas sp.]|nr:DNA repair protein RecN [Candidatus Enteromonas sp.]